jgi:hypothetical protein
MTNDFLSPTDHRDSRTDVFVSYLRYYRELIVARVASLDATAQRSSSLPSEWSPLELVQHLSFVERRWLEWGFLGRDVTDPWGDREGDRWRVGPNVTVTDVFDGLRAQALRSDVIITTHSLNERGQPGPRWEGSEPATLERVLFHLLQEYARHAGHMDIVAELAGGDTGE